jgi:hypothetical protein
MAARWRGSPAARLSRPTAANMSSSVASEADASNCCTPPQSRPRLAHAQLVLASSVLVMKWRFERSEAQ